MQRFSVPLATVCKDLTSRSRDRNVVMVWFASREGKETRYNLNEVFGRLSSWSSYTSLACLRIFLYTDDPLGAYPLHSVCVRVSPTRPRSTSRCY